MSLQYIEGIQGQVDTNEIIKQLRAVLAAEWLAAHSYRVQQKIIQGVFRDDIIKELEQHEQEEDGHANMIMARILQLGGNPEIRPLDWDSHTKCRYAPNVSWDEEAVLENALAGERCAVDHYSKVAEFVKTRDATTHHILIKIIKDEYEHIRDLTKLLEMVRNEGETSSASSTDQKDK